MVVQTKDAASTVSTISTVYTAVYLGPVKKTTGGTDRVEIGVRWRNAASSVASLLDFRADFLLAGYRCVVNILTGQNRGANKWNTPIIGKTSLDLQ